MLLGVLKATVGLFGKSLESSGDFSTRCQYLASNLLSWCVGKCGWYVVLKVGRSPVSCGFFLSVRESNLSNAPVYGLLSVSSFLHIFDMLLLYMWLCLSFFEGT